MAKPKKPRKSQATGKRHAPTGRPVGRPLKKLNSAMKHVEIDLEQVHNKDEWHGMFDAINAFRASGKEHLVRLAEEMLVVLFGNNSFQFSNTDHRIPLLGLVKSLKSTRSRKRQLELFKLFLDKTVGTRMAPWIIDNVKSIKTRIYETIRTHAGGPIVTEDELRFLEFLANYSRFRTEGEFIIEFIKRKAKSAYLAVRHCIGPANDGDIASLALQKIVTAGTYNLTAPEADKKALLKEAVKSARADILRKYEAEQENISLEDADEEIFASLVGKLREKFKRIA